MDILIYRKRWFEYMSPIWKSAKENLEKQKYEKHIIKYPSEFSLDSDQYKKNSKRRNKLILRPSDFQYNLTISHERKFVWFRVAKVGTRTLTYILESANIEHSYLIGVYYPINLYKDYFKFAFVRNPWDRIVSCWLNKVIKSKKNRFKFSDDEALQMKNFESFVDYVAAKIDLDYGDIHLRLQSRTIDLNHIDHLGRFENFEDDLKEILSLLDIQAEIVKKNASKRNPDYRTYYTNSAKDKVAKLYRKDIDIFGYDF